MKRDDDFINYWNRRVNEDNKEEYIGWIAVILVWIIGYIVFYNLLK